MTKVLMPVLSLLACLTHAGFAQNASDVEMKPEGSYGVGQFDVVDLSSGNLYLNIPLASFPQVGRLPPLVFSVALDNAPYSQQDAACIPDSDECDFITTRLDTSPPGAPDQAPLQSDNEPGPRGVSGYHEEYIGFGGYIQTMGAHLVSSYDGGVVNGSLGYSTQGGTPTSVLTYSLVDPSGSTHNLDSDQTNPSVYRTPDGTGYAFFPAGTSSGRAYDINDPENFGQGSGISNLDSNAYWITDPVLVSTSGVRLGTVLSPLGISYTTSIVNDSTLPQTGGHPGRALKTVASDRMNNTVTRGVWYWGGYYLQEARTPSTLSQIQSYYQANPPVFVDSVGRKISDVGALQSVLGPSPSAQILWTVPGPTGDVTYTITYQRISGSDLAAGAGSGDEWDGNFTAPDPSISSAFAGYAISTIKLPNNTSWKFDYSGADLMDVVTPSGSKVSFSYITMPSDASQRFARCGSVCHAVSERDEDDGEGNIARTYYHYAYDSSLRVCSPEPSYPSASAGYTTTVTDPMGNDTVHTFCPVIIGGRPGVFTSRLYSEFRTEYYQGSSSATPAVLLKSVATTYRAQWDTAPGISGNSLSDLAIANVLPDQITTSVPGAGATTEKRLYAVDDSPANALFTGVKILCSGSSPNETCAPSYSTAGPANAPAQPTVAFISPTHQKTYSGTSVTSSALLREAVTNYVYEDPTLGPAYKGANVFDLPQSQSILDAQQPQHPVVAVTYGYDLSGCTQGECGNQTSVTRGLNGADTVTTTTTFDTMGRPVNVVDGWGNSTGATAAAHTTILAYNTTWPNLIESVQQPTTTNGVSHKVSFTYYTSLGKVNTQKDQNGNVTTYSYDTVGRTTKVAYPDGGETDYCFTDILFTGGVSTCFGDSTANTVYTTTVATPSIVTSQVFDNLGREISNTVMPSTSGAITTNTSYDLDGRVLTVSAPHGVNDSGQSTTFTYDALGRKVQQQQPDGSNIWWCYNGIKVSADSLQLNCQSQIGASTGGSWVDETDAVGKHTQQVSDLLGRLAMVFEPDPTTGALSSTAGVPFLETDYQYNLLDNLTDVYQRGGASGNGVQHRAFNYDSLSRLISSTNPENGSVCYGAFGANGCAEIYDGNGNLKQRTDARGVTTSFNYDALNRMLSAQYSDGTLSKCFSYDTSTGGVGYLAAEWTQSGACSSAPPVTAVSRTQALTYDAMGRVTKLTQCVLQTCAAGSEATLNRFYDLAGNLTYQDNGHSVVGIGFTNHYDAAGRLDSLTSTWSDVVHPGQLFHTPTYSPAGLTQANLGNLLTIHHTYDPFFDWLTGGSVTH